MVLNDDIYQLREDLDLCIINGSNFEAKYNFFIFDKNTMKMANGLGCFETLNISLEDNCIKLKGEVAEDIKANVDLNKMKIRVEEKHKQNLMQQLIENNKNEEEKLQDCYKEREELYNILDDIENKHLKTREPSEKDKNILLDLQKKLKNIDLDLNLEYEKEDGMLTLNGIYKNLTFSKYELRELISLVQENIDGFYIVPYYGEEDVILDDINSENINAVGISIIIGISLIEK